MTTTAPSAPTIFVLFGATGDLARRMVLPAFDTLARSELLPEHWQMIGNGRGRRSDDEFRAHVREVLEGSGAGLDEAAWATLEPHLRFAGGGFAEDDPGELVDVVATARRELAEEAGVPPADVQVVLYLALPPSTFVPYTRALAAHGLADGARVVYEKPYGTDAASFEELDALVLSVFAEDQVFRIDHFLGKEATQQLHVLRFANRLLEQVWGAENVQQVQVDVPETLDVADRAGFYDATGAVLDMLVTHLLQVAAEVALEPPAGPSPDDLLVARESVLASFRPIDPGEVVLGQAEGYLDLPEVDDASRTDTFVAARLWVDTDRWRGVPFLLRTGKQLAVSAQRVSLVLREAVTHVPFGEPDETREVITFDLAGSGGIEIRVTAQRPGSETELSSGVLRLDLEDLPAAEPLPPYSRLLRDVLDGDRALFTSSDGLREAWRVVAPLLADPPPVHPYPVGSWGPPQAEALAEPVGWLVRD